MEKKKTLWERLTEKPKAAVPLELQRYNPWKVRLGSVVTIDKADYTGLAFVLKEIRETNRTINDVKLQFVDYLIEAKTDEGEQSLRVRLNPLAKMKDGLEYDTLLLSLYDDLAWDEGIQSLCNTSKTFETTDNDQQPPVSSLYYRIGDMSGPLGGDVSVVKEIPNTDTGKNQTGLVESKFDLWDWSRPIKDIAGQDSEEFLFVEMNKDNGWFQIWQGQRVDPTRIATM